MTYRLLPPDEWNRLAPIMEMYSQPLPSIHTATAAVAEDAEGNIQGVLFYQMAMHLEPLIIFKPHVNFLRLQKTIEDNLIPGTEYLCYTKDDHVDRMVTLGGMQRIGSAWGKRI